MSLVINEHELAQALVDRAKEQLMPEVERILDAEVPKLKDVILGALDGLKIEVTFTKKT